MIPWTVAYQATLSMEFSMKEYWSGLPFPSPGDLPNPGMEPASYVSPACQVGSLPAEPPLMAYLSSLPFPTGQGYIRHSFCASGVSSF